MKYKMHVCTQSKHMYTCIVENMNRRLPMCMQMYMYTIICIYYPSIVN